VLRCSIAKHGTRPGREPSTFYVRTDGQTTILFSDVTRAGAKSPSHGLIATQSTMSQLLQSKARSGGGAEGYGALTGCEKLCLLKGTGFTGCGKLSPGGHGFSRAINLPCATRL
jgi:hypothetical protein